MRFYNSMAINKSLSTTLGRSLIALILLLLIFNRVDTKVLLEIIRQFDFKFGLIMLLLNVMVILLMAARWQLIAAQIGFKAPFKQFLRGIWLGAFSAQAGPGIIFSEFVRYQTLKKQAQRGLLISSQLVDRLSGQIVLCLMIFILIPWYLPFLTEIFRYLPLVLMLLCLLVLFLILLRKHFTQPSRINHKQKIIQVLLTSAGLRHYALSLLIQLCLMLCFTCAAIGLAPLLEPIVFFLLVPGVLFTLSLFPISISDWGTREAAAIFWLPLSGLSFEKCIAASLIYGVLYSLTALLGVIYVFQSQ